MDCPCIPPLASNYKKIDENAWKKALGTFAQMFNKTGVSEKIRAVVDGYKKFDGAKLDAHTYAKNCCTPKQFEDEYNKAKTYLDTILPKMTHPLGDLKVQLKKAIPELEKAKTVPKSCVQFAKDMVVEVDKALKDLNELSFPALEKDVKSFREQKMKNLGIASGKLKEYSGKWGAAVSKLRQDLSKATDDKAKLIVYDSFRTEYVRGFSTSLPFFKNDPNVGKHYSPWNALAQDGGMPKAASAIEPLIKKLEQMYGAMNSDLKLSGII